MACCSRSGTLAIACAGGHHRLVSLQRSLLVSLSPGVGGHKLSSVRCLSTGSLVYASPKHWPNGPKDDWAKGIYNYDWRHARAKKVAKIPMPEFDKQRAESKSDLIRNLTPDDLRSKMKEMGVVPQRQWNLRPIQQLCSMEIFDPFVPSEEDKGQLSIVNVTDRFKEKATGTGKKVKSRLQAIRRIRSFHPDFDMNDFATGEALDIYIRAHEMLARNDIGQDFFNKQYIDLLDLVTENAYAEMMHNTHLRTIRWKYIKAIEEPLCVHAKVTEVANKNNFFGQMTVRFHSEQQLAVYDRFGRLIYGSEAAVKNVLEYVVFEQYLTSRFGKWRLHAKIIPDWAPKRESSRPTFAKPIFSEESDEERKQREEKEAKLAKEDDKDSTDEPSKGGQQPLGKPSLLNRLRDKYLSKSPNSVMKR